MCFFSGFGYAGNPIQIVGQAEHLRLPRPARGEEEGGQGEGGHRHPLHHQQAEEEGIYPRRAIWNKMS